jgi:hypothetical protein
MLATSVETRYMVREAVLDRTWSGYAWTVKFAPVAFASEDDEIVVMISPMELDELTFAHPYTREEIQEFADLHHP